LRSKRTNDNPPKKVVETNKATETKKTVKTKKTSETSPQKVPEWNNVKSSAKRNPEILKRSNQTKVSSTNQLSTYA
jgi:hypothetical protein